MKQTTSPTRKNSRSFPFAATTFALTGLALIAGLVKAPAAHAHVAIASGTVVANASQEVTFTVGHGCAGADTVKVRVEIPTGVTSVRPETSDFGKTSVEKDATGAITSVTWQKAEADVLEADTQYYKLLVRLKTPNTPFTTLLFPAHQTCRAADRTVSVVDWTALPTDPPPATGEAEPAPSVAIVPAHVVGWNKVMVPLDVPSLAAFFTDAQIVWKGAAAYSANPTTAELIAATPGVTPLKALAANDTVWVKY